jgi:hypothetical protein
MLQNYQNINHIKNSFCLNLQTKSPENLFNKEAYI